MGASPPSCLRPRRPLPPQAQQHGFARNVEWALAEEGAGRCVLALDSSDATLAQWPHPFRLEMEVRGAC